MPTETEEAKTEISIAVKCNRVRYKASINNGQICLRALPGYPDVAQTGGIPLRDVLVAHLVTEEVLRPVDTSWTSRFESWLPSRENGSSGDYTSTVLHNVVLHLARRVAHQKWRTKKVTLEVEVPEEADRLCDSINEYIAGLKNRPKRLMFFVNPISGNGQAEKIMRKYLLPSLDLSGIFYQFMVTTSEGHAKNWIIQHSQEEKFDGIISVGGDGIFNEIMEGVLAKAQQGNLSAATPLNIPGVRLGLIPAGSTDSIGFCIGLGDHVTSLLHILLGHHMLLDVGAVFRAADGSFLKFFCAFLGYGFFSDTMKNSEKAWLRKYLGKSRYMLAGARTFLVNRAYHGSVSFRSLDNPPEGYPDSGAECYKDCSYCYHIGSSKTNVSDLTRSTEGILDHDQPWHTMEGKFTNVIAASMSCRSEMSPKGVVPVSHCGDGCLDLLIVKSIGRFRLLKYLIGTSKGVGPQRSLGRKLHACRAYELKFHTKTPSEADQRASLSTVWNCDGEIVTEPNIHVKVYCQLIEVYGSGLEKE